MRVDGCLSRDVNFFFHCFFLDAISSKMTGRTFNWGRLVWQETLENWDPEVKKKSKRKGS